MDKRLGPRQQLLQGTVDFLWAVALSLVSLTGVICLTLLAFAVIVNIARGLF